MDHKARIKNLQHSLVRHRLDALLVTHMPNVRYLCGFTGSSGALLVTPQVASLHTDGRYTMQAREETRAARLRLARGSPSDAAIASGSRGKVTTGFEADDATVSERETLA